MPVREVEYDDLTVRAAAFEVVGTGSFIVSLAIVANAGDIQQERVRLIELPTSGEWFCDVEEALEFAIGYGQAIIDGDVPGQSVADL